MHVVMGATGHVGGAVARALLAQQQEVTVLTRQPAHAQDWLDRGAQVLAADAEDAVSLRAAFRNASRIFVLNPPADTGGDTDRTERRTIANILEALDGLHPEKIVAASTYGAQPGDAIGDLSTLWELEAGLNCHPAATAINRGAYYMTNWLGFADSVRDAGVLPSMFPANQSMPMVAPDDLGEAAAARLLATPADCGIEFVEGPERYTPRDVADAFAATLDRDVTVEVVPRERWEAGFRQAGFSAEAARAYTRMTEVSLDNDFAAPAQPRRGATTLRAFIAAALPAA